MGKLNTISASNITRNSIDALWLYNAVCSMKLLLFLYQTNAMSWLTYLFVLPFLQYGYSSQLSVDDYCSLIESYYQFRNIHVVTHFITFSKGEYDHTIPIVCALKSRI